MISLEHAKRSERLMRATTSLTVSEFDVLAGRFEVAWTAARSPKTGAGTARQRRPGDGPKGCCTLWHDCGLIILKMVSNCPGRKQGGIVLEPMLVP